MAGGRNGAGPAGGDEGRLRQILVNLVGNAVKFTEEGRIEVQARSRFVPERDQVLLEIAVEDTGIGIPADKHDLLFQSFSQLSPVINRKYGGTGLGLAICKKLVELMGGSIGVESREHEGSTFSFVVPLTPPGKEFAAAALHPAIETDVAAAGRREDRPALAPEEAVDYSALRILVADDNGVNRQLLHSLLRKHGCEADSAGSGLEALEASKTEEYDLIFMDLEMPDMDGLEATRAIRQHYSPGEGPVIVAVTAYARRDDRERCFEAGMMDYISKPVFAPEVERVLRQWAPRSA
ncbi:ATP-binding protein [Paenibacillus sp. CC-CFT747]|nr:ATP-binding protein [Paenibacillus sp. CC-CFT747]